MQNLLRRAALAILIFVGTLIASSSADAESFPTKPVRVVVPYGPGGAADQLARVVADRLSKTLGQPAIVENKPGAGGIVAADYVAKSPPDGHTIFLASFASFVSNPLLTPDLPYEVDRDFEGISLVATTPMVLIVNPDVPARSVAEFVAYTKAHPGRMNFGTSGAGSTVHLAAELFKAVTGVEMVHVPYKSSADVLNAMASRDIQVAFDLILTAKPQIEAGTVRALAVTERARTSLLPDLPTIAETGYPAYEMSTWFGLAVRKGTPANAIERLNAEIARIVDDPELRRRFALLGMELRPSTPGELMAQAARERGKWREIIASQGIRLR
jgi:tripartite-type tricarboxylate transporter receptor subunit TctC